MTNELYYSLVAEKRLSIKVSECGATPLVDATTRFLKEFMVEESPSTEWQSQPATGRISRANGEKEDGDVVDLFEPRTCTVAQKTVPMFGCFAKIDAA